MFLLRLLPELIDNLILHKIVDDWNKAERLDNHLFIAVVHLSIFLPCEIYN